MPENPNKPYDMRELIVKTVDDGDFFELQPEYAKNILIGFARIFRHPINPHFQPAGKQECADPCGAKQQQSEANRAQA